MTRSFQSFPNRLICPALGETHKEENKKANANKLTSIVNPHGDHRVVVTGWMILETRCSAQLATRKTKVTGSQFLCTPCQQIFVCGSCRILIWKHQYCVLHAHQVWREPIHVVYCISNRYGKRASQHISISARSLPCGEWNLATFEISARPWLPHILFSLSGCDDFKKISRPNSVPAENILRESILDKLCSFSESSLYACSVRVFLGIVQSATDMCLDWISVQKCLPHKSLFWETENETIAHHSLVKKNCTAIFGQRYWFSTAYLPGTCVTYPGDVLWSGEWVMRGTVRKSMNWNSLSRQSLKFPMSDDRRQRAISQIIGSLVISKITCKMHFCVSPR